jgi:hypothetical protein
MGDQFADHFSRACDSDWCMRCFARPRDNNRGDAAGDNNYRLTKAAE